MKKHIIRIEIRLEHYERTKAGELKCRIGPFSRAEPGTIIRFRSDIPDQVITKVEHLAFDQESFIYFRPRYGEAEKRTGECLDALAVKCGFADWGELTTHFPSPGLYSLITFEPLTEEEKDRLPVARIMSPYEIAQRKRLAREKGEKVGLKRMAKAR